MKKTGKFKNAHALHRLAATILIVALLTCGIAVTVFATVGDELTGISEESNQVSTAGAIAGMNQKIYTIYRTIRNNIAFPLLSLSFASCGFKILGAGILGSGMGVDKGIQAAKEQIFISICALIFILALPNILTFAIGLFRGNAWVPPAVILLPPSGLGGFSL